MKLKKLGLVGVVGFIILAGCGEPAFEPTAISPAPASTFESEAHPFLQTDFSNAPAQFQIMRVKSPYEYPKGTVIVDPAARFVYFIETDDNIALRYPIAVGREGFEWTGSATIARRAKWPTWRPTPSMLKDNPNLEKVVKGGTKNPLGARALYLYDDKGNDTLYRIHGTNNPSSIGTASSSGCIRMFNEHVIDLYNRVPSNAPVVVLPLDAAQKAATETKKPKTFGDYMDKFFKVFGNDA